MPLRTRSSIVTDVLTLILLIIPPSDPARFVLSRRQHDYNHWRILGKVGLAWEGGSVRLGATVIGKSQEADVKFTRWVFLIGYLFGR